MLRQLRWNSSWPYEGPGKQGIVVFNSKRLKDRETQGFEMLPLARGKELTSEWVLSWTQNENLKAKNISEKLWTRTKLLLLRHRAHPCRSWWLNNAERISQHTHSFVLKITWNILKYIRESYDTLFWKENKLRQKSGNCKLYFLNIE